MTIACCICSIESPEVPIDGPLTLALMWLSYEKNWALSMNAKGYFICCPTCYPMAFTLEFGGSVGLVRNEFENRRRPLNDRELI